MDKVKLGDVVDILDSRRIPVSSKERATREKIYPYYGAQGIVDYIDDYLFDGDYILVAEDGNNLKALNEPIVTWATGQFWVNNHAHILGDNGCSDIRFIYYYLMASDLRGLITGSAQPKLNQENLASFVMELPSISEQRASSALLGNIDDKITNNQKLIKELSQTARLIYDYWFTQFDFPDENGKSYRSSGGKMVWNEELKREIPEGWEVGTVADLISGVRTGLNPRNNFKLTDSGWAYLTVKNLTVTGEIDFSSCDFIDDEAREIAHKRSDVSEGDVLFASISPLGRCHLVQSDPDDWEINESIFSIRPNNEVISSEFLYMFFTSLWFVKAAEGSSAGSVFKGIRHEELRAIRTFIPKSSIVQAFTDKVSTLLKTMNHLSDENKELVSLRDWLLPMLMNGQVKVS